MVEHLGQDRVGEPRRADTSDAPNASLKDLSADFKLFTTALINTVGRFDRDPLQEFLRYKQLPAKRRPAALDFDRPLFRDIGDGLLVGTPVAWDHRIYAIPLEEWEDCLSFIGGLAAYDKEKKFYARFAWHDIEVPDVAAAHGAPWVPVTAFACASNKAFTYLVPPEVGIIGDLPHPKSERPRDAEVLEANTLMS